MADFISFSFYTHGCLFLQSFCTALWRKRMEEKDAKWPIGCTCAFLSIAVSGLVSLDPSEMNKIDFCCNEDPMCWRHLQPLFLCRPPDQDVLNGRDSIITSHFILGHQFTPGLEGVHLIPIHFPVHLTCSASVPPLIGLLCFSSRH